MVGVPDPIFSGPSIKEKIAVWLRETKLSPFMVLVQLAESHRRPVFNTLLVDF